MINIFNIFRKKDTKGKGGLPDPRPLEEIAKDYRSEEVASFAPVVWKEKTWADVRKFTIFDQDGSGSCVSQATAKVLGIENLLEEGRFMDLSARDIYTRRMNAPNEGMWGADACEIARKYGATLRVLMPSDLLDEGQMNRATDRTVSTERIGKVFQAKNWVSLPFDIEKIAQVIQSGKGALLFFKWDYKEWDIPDPTIMGNNIPYHHALAGVDFGLMNGKKGIFVDDSWGKNRGVNGQRFVSEEWFNPANGRITWASYFEDLSNLEIQNGMLDRPKILIMFPLYMGMKNDTIAMLQRCLGYLKDSEGYLFPLNQSPTGYYGGITRTAVKRYQTLRNLPVTGIVDVVTMQSLNTEFN